MMDIETRMELVGSILQYGIVIGAVTISGVIWIDYFFNGWSFFLGSTYLVLPRDRDNLFCSC